MIESPRLIGIYTSEGKGQPMQRHETIRVLEGIGLEGDRYASRAAHGAAFVFQMISVKFP